MSRRSHFGPYACVIVGLACAACTAANASLEFGNVVTSGDTVSMSAVAGTVIARDSATGADGAPMPCCALDSAGVHIQATTGMMTFFAATSYTEMMYTPAGPRPVACVQGAPDGSILGLNNLLTLTDGESYLLMPCTAGFYSVTLTDRLTYPDGSSTTRQVTVSSGRYGWQRDLMSLHERSNADGATAAMSGATITVTVGGHRYSFLALGR